MITGLLLINLPVMRCKDSTLWVHDRAELERADN